MKAGAARRAGIILICLLCISALAAARWILSYPIKLNLATLPEYISQWYSRGQEPELRHGITLYDGVELGNRSYYLLEIDEGESGQQFGYVTLEKGPLGRYKILHMGYGGGSLFDGVIEADGKLYFLLGGRDPGERIFRVTAVLGGQSYEFEIPRESGHFLLYTEIAGGSGLADMGTDTVKEGSHADRGEITFYDRQGGDITSLYNLSGGGFQ